MRQAKPMIQPNEIKQKPAPDPASLQKMAIIIACVSFVLYFPLSLMKPNKQLANSLNKFQAALNQKRNVIPGKASVASSKPIPTSVPAPVASSIQTTPSPNSSTAATPPSEPTLAVQGIMAQGTSNIALINNRIYEEGSEINGMKIVKINLNNLVVTQNGQEKTISMGN